jgi:hypothetical protein
MKIFRRILIVYATDVQPAVRQMYVCASLIKTDNFLSDFENSELKFG